MSLPSFKYHPDPLKTEVVIKSDTMCVCCEQYRGYIYTGPVYAVGEYTDTLCPRCIADGSAAEKFEANFTDSAPLHDEHINDAIIHEIVAKTPGFAGWQQERWCACCDDGAAFLGAMGTQELLSYGDKAIAAIQAETGLDGTEWDAYFNHLDKDYGPTAYLFQCLHCEEFVGYSDYT